MKKLLLLSMVVVISLSGCSESGHDDRFHEAFVEDFSGSSSEYFQYHVRGQGEWDMGLDSPTEPGTKILSFKLDPEQIPGGGRGPEIISNKYTHYGTYSARLRVPDPRELQPDIGAVVGYFTYRMDSIQGLSEIDFEWLIADPEIIYVGTWTGPRGDLRRIGRTINMAEGIIYNTSYRERTSGERRNLRGEQNQPETIEPIPGYDASAQFYTYGFDWYPERIRWWMIHPHTGDKVVLWDYQGSEIGIPTAHTNYRMNFWHTNDWSVQTNPNSIEKPQYNFELEVDWMSYEPWDGKN